MNEFASAHLAPRYRSSSPPPDLSAGQAQVRSKLLASDEPGHWESTACLCGAAGGRVLTDVDRYGLPYRKVLCTDCGLLRVTPRWTASRYARFYADDYRDLYSPLSGAGGEETVQRLAESAGALQVSRFVETAWERFGDRTLARPTIVEIGAGGGWNLSRLSERWRRIGYDSDERFLALGRSLFGIEMRNGFLAEALTTVADADCILLSHVLEHTGDPVATLRDIAAAARPDALILIEVPGIFRLHKTSLDPMRYWQNAHTYTFCARTAVDTSRRAGLEPLSVDEWVRLVLRPSSMARSQGAPDPALARSIERYLRYCERSHRLVQTAARLPIAGAKAAWLLRRSADAAMRLAAAVGLVHGIRANGAPS